MRQTAILIMIIVCAVAGAMDMLHGDGARMTVYRIEAEMIESIDSAIVYMPIKDEYRMMLKSFYEPKAKDVLLYEINAQNISPRKYDHNNHPEILDSIKSYINNSIEIDTLSYNTSQLIKHTPSDIRPNYVGVIWNTEGKDLDALVILFIKNEIELLWIGLDYVEYKNLRIKCDIFKLLKKHAV